MGEEPESIREVTAACLKAAEPGPGQVDDAAADCVRRALAGAFEGAASDEQARLALVGEAAEGVIDSARSLGAPIWHLARGALRGALEAALATGDLAGEALDPRAAARSASAALLRHTDAIGGDIKAAAKGAVEGAVLAAEALALEEREFASVAADAALKAARALRADAWEQVLPVVRGPIQGVPVRITVDSGGG